ncbi:MAG: ergothioneine biosynthesis protein EgtB [Gammaproteobacteria bacterium]|nr:ergothioneine biosynthesis protein EgtB [Gammaproteobacteria bacterium]
MNDLSSAKFNSSLLTFFQQSREASKRLCENLEVEDYGLQAIAETSPIKWHLAHTSWFYETFVLKPFANDYTEFNAAFQHLFNSYYNGVGQPFKRPNRGLLSRPTVAEVWRYRQIIDDAIAELILSLPTAHAPNQAALIEQRIELGIQHEKQHQELMLTDLKYNFYQNPLLPSYDTAPLSEITDAPANRTEWYNIESGLYEVGFSGNGFHFDNETPRHKTYLNSVNIATQLVSNAAFLKFMQDGGYQRPELWLSDGWDWVQSQSLSRPLYWFQNDQQWYEYTLYGPVKLDPSRPLCHVSFYEADAYARWCGARLPSEFEWEVYATSASQADESTIHSPQWHPNACADNDLQQQVWQWTASSYAAYPGFQPPSGAIGEYNGKFMCNQMVLRGGSCLSPPQHTRLSYRNFFYPETQWQMSGIRLAQDIDR